MNKKVLLVTLFDEGNIGNRLQNYALQTKLISYGVEVTTLDNYYTTDFSTSFKLKMLIKRLLIKIGFKKYKIDYERYQSLKNIMLSNINFDNTNLYNVIKIKNEDSFKHDWSQYELAISGSDQVWHKWKHDLNELPYYYLEFMPKEKRTSYAASFGFEEFPQNDIEQHIKGLQGMNKISCREQSGCNLVHKYVGKEAVRVLDPTLLLSADEWRNIEHKSGDIQIINLKKKYVFMYFLGEITDEYYDFIRSTMEENNINEVFDFFDESKSHFVEKGPSEFINLIDNAEYVFTDSFHCTVFSLLFNKRFKVFRRQQTGFEKMFGRIEDLLASKGALEHIYGETEIKPTNDFDKLYNDSIKYLELILNI